MNPENSAKSTQTLDSDSNAHLKNHADQYVHYTHEMSDDTQEASGRFVMRVVPILYGVMVGGLLDSVPTGLVVGAAISVVLDLTMGSSSLFLPAFRKAARAVCPVAAAMMQSLSRAIGLPIPHRLRNLRCGAQ